jgi:hypothetical protein
LFSQFINGNFPGECGLFFKLVGQGDRQGQESVNVDTLLDPEVNLTLAAPTAIAIGICRSIPAIGLKHSRHLAYHCRNLREIAGRRLRGLPLVTAKSRQ